MLEHVNRLKTGIAGLDDILGGGLPSGHVFLLEGNPGTGKTTIALQFLMEGAERGERGLYITLSETEHELRQSALSHGWTLSDLIEVFEVVPPETALDADAHQSLLYPADLELGEVSKAILGAVKRSSATRVIVDSLSEFRLLAQDPLRYRRQILALKHFFAGQRATVVLLDDMTTDAGEKTVHTVAHGVVVLEELAPDYGAERRRLRVTKLRGQKYRGGYHDFVITIGGVQVFPRLVAAEDRAVFHRTKLGSGIAALDALLGGGIEQGTSALLLGPSGAGKSLFVLQFIKSAIQRGERCAMFVFDEELGLLYDRSKALGFDLEAAAKDEKAIVQQVDAAELSPGEFAHRVRYAVRDSQAKTVAIDSLNGYQAAMPNEKALLLHVHELLQHLNRQGATTLLTVAQHGLLGDMLSPVDVTYLADVVVLLRYFEAEGRVRRAISIVKKRAGHHEDTIREYAIEPAGIRIGEPLIGFQGVLRGVPTYRGQQEPLLQGGEPK